MKYGKDRIRITYYDEQDENSCSIVVGHLDTLYICKGNYSGAFDEDRKLEICEHELYYLLKEFLDNH
jgi:hypothetical protein